MSGDDRGPDRPRRETEQEYLTAISEACPPETWREIVESAVKHAKQGDAAARAWLASYLVGKPKGNAPTLRSVVVDELAGVDTLEGEAADRQTWAALAYGKGKARRRSPS